MFVLSEIQDTISVHPSSFGSPSLISISNNINVKYANKILVDVGLCISLFDILSCSEGKVRFGDGCLYHHVTFRLIVFRPFTQEVLTGKIKSSDESGFRISLGFFDDIYVLHHLIPKPCAFDHQERAWFWLYEARTDEIAADPLLSQQDERMYLDTGEVVRFTVESDVFYDGEPGPGGSGTKGGGAAGAQAGQQGAAEQGGLHHNQHTAKETKPHYSITASIAGSGLGLVSWWAGAEAATNEPGVTEEYAGEEMVQEHYEDGQEY
ncbi:related to RPC25 - DNA-direcred RNA polymerase III, 25 KD subunit [Melanopsichium pennsylvanicum]|uniref:Related to RPC25 - DNA-direcred RNA polymerase III, 25 KD subunit n=2 Tax=Melanopsichium pennsylvanicum TaxID=63383 RepID=A0AAJ4XJT6_9BASI|nr:related to RPC25-DNA-direcred RNA polymerase III, 25 KD subunit [Melanopsichium pennsylvanicum 4]SNX83795.1 related to RPC25 - DNA-direcred RNA polymerase III, 25 KD subunit [Melanopsichium pennsylvanicum]